MTKLWVWFSTLVLTQPPHAGAGRGATSVTCPTPPSALINGLVGFNDCYKYLFEPFLLTFSFEDTCPKMGYSLLQNRNLPVL